LFSKIIIDVFGFVLTQTLIIQTNTEPKAQQSGCYCPSTYPLTAFESNKGMSCKNEYNESCDLLNFPQTVSAFWFSSCLIEKLLFKKVGTLADVEFIKCI